MTFPVSPTNGQVTTVNGITYTYNSTDNAWSRTAQPVGNLTVSGNVTVGRTLSIANTGDVSANIGAYQTYANANIGTIKTNLNTLDANVGAYEIYANANIGSIKTSLTTLDANVGAYEIYANANIGTISTNLNTLDANVGAYEIYANANIGTIKTNLSTLDANVGAYETYANANIGTIKTNLSTLDANVGAYEIYANANIGTISTNLNTLDANVGAYETYANANIGTVTNNITNIITNSNTNTAAYLANGISSEIKTSGNIVAAATTSSTNTTTGALVVKGGAGIAGAVNVGTSITVDGGYGNVVTTQFASVFGRAVGSNATSLMQVKANDGTTGMGMRVVTGSSTLIYSSGIIDFSTGVTVRDLDVPTGIAAGTGVRIAANGAVIALTGIASTSTGTGALIISGGTGISGELYITNTGDVSANIGTIKTNAQLLDANVGAYQTYANANAASQTISISSLSSGANTNTAAYLTGYTGSVSSLSITSGTEAYNPASGALQVTGGVGISGNLFVNGNIYAANLISIAASTLSVQDPLLYLTASSPSPYNYDIGLYSQFASTNYQHTGLVRDYATNRWGLFSNVQSEPGTTINWSDSGLIWDPLKVGALTIANNTPSSSTSSGALVVTGGAGIGGVLYIANTGDVSANIGAYQLFANANVVAIQANLGAYQTYANASVVAIQANLGAYQLFANANVVSIQANLGAYQTYANANVTAIQANLGAYQTYANANVTAIQSNLGAYQTWANTSITSLYTSANANTAAYLTTYTGNIQAGNIAVTGNVNVTSNVFASVLYTTNGIRWSGNGVAFTSGGGGGGTFTASATAPSSPSKGDQWYYTGSDILFEYIDDGDSLQWVDVSSPTTPTNSVLSDLVLANVSISSVYNLTSTRTALGMLPTVGTTPPVSPVRGDFWYNTSEDILYQYTYDGTSNYWVDITSETFSSSAGSRLLDTTITGNLVPSANVTYSLGTSTQRFKDLFLSGTTIDLGGATIKTDASSGAIALIPQPTVANPNPTGIVVSPAGTVSTVSTTGGNLTANAISNSSNTAVTTNTTTFGNITSNGNVITANVYADRFFYSNGTAFSSSSFGNTEVAAYLVANPQGSTYSNSNVATYLTSNISGMATRTDALTVPVGTTAQRPATASNGAIRYNTTTGGLETYLYIAGWRSIISDTYTIEYLAVAGGGGSGRSNGAAGGGAGGLLNGTFSATSNTVIAIVVGGGGPAATSTSAKGSNGDNSTIAYAGVTTIGGGGSGTESGGTYNSGAVGGSGGGGVRTGTGAAGTAGQGNAGGSNVSDGSPHYGGGGGGGAGAAGTNGSAGGSGNGGIGLDFSAWATATSTGDSGYYAGGGAGGSYDQAGAGGSGGTRGTGGGGQGGTNKTTQQLAGQTNTGGGGGGHGNVGSNGGAGGSGIVILRYLGSQRGTGGTYSSSGGYSYHLFTGSTSFTA